MSKQTDRFRRAAKKAKRLYKTGRYKTFADAMKSALKKISGISGSKYRQTGTSKRSADKKRKAKAPGKRVVRHPGAKATVYYERRKNRSDKPGTMSGVDDAKRLLKRRLKERLGNLYMMQAFATNKRNRADITKRVNETKRELKKLE